MIFCECLIDAQKIVIRLNIRDLNLWKCFFPLEIDPKIDIMFIKSIAKRFWVRLELFTHIWNCLSLLLISLTADKPSSKYPPSHKYIAAASA